KDPGDGKLGSPVYTIVAHSAIVHIFLRILSDFFMRLRNIFESSEYSRILVASPSSPAERARREFVCRRRQGPGAPRPEGKHETRRNPPEQRRLGGRSGQKTTPPQPRRRRNARTEAARGRIRPAGTDCDHWEGSPLAA